jgi:hypothetical protein
VAAESADEKGDPSMVAKENAASVVKFSDIKPFLYKLKDTNTATKASLLVAKSLPYGSDRVQGYKTAVTFTEKWAQQKMKDLVSCNDYIAQKKENL